MNNPNNISYISYEESKALDNTLIQQHNITIETLINTAGKRISKWIHDHITCQHLIGIIGKGNNGKDILTAFTHVNTEYTLTLYLCDPDIRHASEFKTLTAQKKVHIISSIREIQTDSIIFDGIFGTGLNRTISPTTKTLIKTINKSPCPIISIDVPSGLKETGAGPCISATFTLTMMFPKTVFLNAEKKDACGKIVVLNFNLFQDQLHPYKFPNTMEPYIKLS